eukprot:919138-Pyramimonas_sp.AAC.1
MMCYSGACYKRSTTSAAGGCGCMKGPGHMPSAPCAKPSATTAKSVSQSSSHHRRHADAHGKDRQRDAQDSKNAY